MISLRREIPVLCTFLIVFYFAGCHGSPNTTQTANASASTGTSENNANSSATNNMPNTSQVAGAEASPGGGANGAHASANNASAPGAQVQTVTIPAGTAIEVRLLNSLSSARNHGGDEFEATVAEPVLVNGWGVIPRGSDVTGRVVAARPSGHLKTPAELSITLASVQVNRERYDLRTSDITRRAASHAKHDAEWIGGLAGGGALLGALIGHGKGAAIGAGVGAGAGATTAYATGQKDIYLPSEKRLTFILRDPLTVSHVG